MSKNLTQPQAEAVYSAMVALNNVYARVHVTFPYSKKSARPPARVEVVERTNGTVVVGYHVNKVAVAEVLESYSSQAAFAAAYYLPT